MLSQWKIMCGFYMRRVFQSCYKVKKKTKTKQTYDTERVINVTAHRVSCANDAEVGHNDCMLESKLLSMTDGSGAGTWLSG